MPSILGNLMRAARARTGDTRQARAWRYAPNAYLGRIGRLPIDLALLAEGQKGKPFQRFNLTGAERLAGCARHGYYLRVLRVVERMGCARSACGGGHRPPLEGESRVGRDVGPWRAKVAGQWGTAAAPRPGRGRDASATSWPIKLGPLRRSHKDRRPPRACPFATTPKNSHSKIPQKFSPKKIPKKKKKKNSVIIIPEEGFPLRGRRWTPKRIALAQFHPSGYPHPHAGPTHRRNQTTTAPWPGPYAAARGSS